MDQKKDAHSLVGTWTLTMDVSSEGQVAVWLTYNPSPYRPRGKRIVKRHHITQLPETDTSHVSWYELIDHCGWALWYKQA